MAGQYPPNDPYTSGDGGIPGSQYFTSPDPNNPTEQFSPFFTQDFLPLSSPTTPYPPSTYPPNVAHPSYPAGPTNPQASAMAQPYTSQQYNDIEEEKRRRNTAASARFRVKKKEREQILEKQAQDVQDRVRGLEGRVQMLERENGWLRGLVGEKRRNLLGSEGSRRKDGDGDGDDEGGRGKSGRKGGADSRGKGRSSKGNEEREERSVRSPRKRNDGVGTRS